MKMKSSAEDYRGEVPQRWKVLSQKVPEELGIPHAVNFTIRNVRAVTGPIFERRSQAFLIEGLPEAPFENFTFRDIEIEAAGFGRISAVKNLQMQNVNVKISGSSQM